MRILSWVLTVLFVVALAQTVLLFVPGIGDGFGDAFARLVLTLMLWCFARSARETAQARSAAPARWHHAR
jgi:hypothetical protein